MYLHVKSMCVLSFSLYKRIYIINFWWDLSSMCFINCSIDYHNLNSQDVIKWFCNQIRQRNQNVLLKFLWKKKCKFYSPCLKQLFFHQGFASENFAETFWGINFEGVAILQRFPWSKFLVEKKNIIAKQMLKTINIWLRFCNWKFGLSAFINQFWRFSYYSALPITINVIIKYNKIINFWSRFWNWIFGLRVLSNQFWSFSYSSAFPIPINVLIYFIP